MHWENYISISFHITWSWWHYSFDFEPNGFPIGSKSKGKLSPLSYPIQYERKYSFLSVIWQPDRKNVTDQTYSCPRDWRLSASGGPIEGPPETPRTSQHYHIEEIKGLPDLEQPFEKMFRAPELHPSPLKSNVFLAGKCQKTPGSVLPGAFCVLLKWKIHAFFVIVFMSGDNNHGLLSITMLCFYLIKPHWCCKSRILLHRNI